MRDVVIVLAGTQLADNIGSIARVMANFGIFSLRLAAPRCEWPNQRAYVLACHAGLVIDNCEVYGSIEDAVNDLNYLYATTVRPRYMEKLVISSSELERDIQNVSGKIGVLFGPEDDGLSNHDMRLVDKIVTVPTHHEYSSMNIAQAVGAICYELSNILPLISDSGVGVLACKEEISGMMGHLEGALDERNFFRVEHKKQEMMKNLSAMFLKASLTSQEVRTIRGIIRMLMGKKPPQ